MDLILVKKQMGIGLIEFLVVITLLIIMTTVVLPMGATWLESLMLHEGASKFQEAYTRARVLAIANPNASSNGNVSAWLCTTDSSVLYVQKAGQSVCGVNWFWRTNLGNGVSIAPSLPSNTVTSSRACFAFDNYGIQLDTVISGVSCTLNRNYIIRKGSISNDVLLY